MVERAAANVIRSYVARTNSMGIDVDKDCTTMLDQICSACRARWHM